MSCRQGGPTRTVAYQSRYEPSLAPSKIANSAMAPLITSFGLGALEQVANVSASGRLNAAIRCCGLSKLLGRGTEGISI